MPTYDYVCPAGHQFELFQKITQKPRARCPTCGKPASRKISGGAGLVFKGSGFYITDYGKDGKGPRKEKEAEGAAKTDSTGPDSGAPKASGPAPAAKPARTGKSGSPPRSGKGEGKGSSE
ncbi:MAG TPA: zinc ribbon domain-containing protein [Gemmatimonadales bacterium]|jgi:putative FmdB family regulatory protein|nr:zinc ribbon domain-containing protein [Gemmatimonadales bacterium]